jgi:hypothetical protein
VQPQASLTHNHIDQGATRQPQLGQSHTAEGELDLSAIYVVHHALRRDLRDFDLAVPATPLADTASWTALRRRWMGFTTVFHHHTQVEDGPTSRRQGVRSQRPAIRGALERP